MGWLVRLQVNALWRQDHKYVRVLETFDAKIFVKVIIIIALPLYGFYFTVHLYARIDASGKRLWQSFVGHSIVLVTGYKYLLRNCGY